MIDPDEHPPAEAPTSERSAVPKASVGVSELRRRALAFGFAGIALASFALLIAVYLPLTAPILWALTLAILFYPLHSRIFALTGERARLAATISTILALAVIIIPAVFGLIVLIGEVRDFWPAVRDSLGPRGFERIAYWIERSRFRGLFHFLLGSASGPEAVQARVAELAYSVQDFLLEQLRNVTKSVPAVIIQIGITVLSFFFFLLRGRGWSREIQAALPLDREHAKRLADIFSQTINIVFRGVVLTAAVQAVVAGAGYWVAGAPTPVLLSFFTLIAALIPFVGPVAIWLPTTVGLFLSGRTGAAIGLGLWGMLVVSLIDNTLRPWLIGRGMKLPVLWLFLAILGGLKLFGFLGVVIGPLSLALALACYRIYREARI